MDKLSRAVKVGEKSEEDLRDKLVLNKVLDEVKFLINESKQILKILSNADWHKYFMFFDCFVLICFCGFAY